MSNASLLTPQHSIPTSGPTRETSPTIQARDIVGINIIRFRGGREVRVEDIETAEQGRLVLAEVDAAILAIEDQIDHADLSTKNGREWRQRAERALKVKRRSRPTLQARIGVLGRSELAAARAEALGREAGQVDAKRKVFIQAAYQLLGHEACTEIWARAAEMAPSAFHDVPQPPLADGGAA